MARAFIHNVRVRMLSTKTPLPPKSYNRSSGADGYNLVSTSVENEDNDTGRLISNKISVTRMQRYEDSQRPQTLFQLKLTQADI